MTVVRKTRCEWGAIVESVGFAAFGELNLPAEGVDFSPPLEDNLLLSRKINRHCEFVAEFEAVVGGFPRGSRGVQKSKKWLMTHPRLGLYRLLYWGKIYTNSCRE